MFIMAEEETKTETTEEKPVEEKKGPISDGIGEIRKEKEEMIKIRDELIAEREKIEALKTDEVLHGTTDAGDSSPEKKEESPQEYKDRIMRGE